VILLPVASHVAEIIDVCHMTGLFIELEGSC
jgi:hypothetical protein